MKFENSEFRWNRESENGVTEATIIGFTHKYVCFSWFGGLAPWQDQVMLLVALKMAHLAVVWKGREIGGTSEDRDSVVQFGSPLCEPSAHLLLTRLKSCAVQFGNCRRPDILKPNLISTSFCRAFPFQPILLISLTFCCLWCFTILTFQRMSWNPVLPTES